VIREAMAAAARGRYRDVVSDVIARLGPKATKAGAHEALIHYGEIAVKELRTALFDSRTPRDIRLAIPRTLSKIHSQSAMNALLSGLLEDDGSIRFNSVRALEEMARRFADLKIDRQIVESAITSDVILYCRRFAIFSVLFANGAKPSAERESLLSQALTDSMERVQERVMWLLSLIYPGRDIRRFWAALHSGEPNKQAHAVEFLENLLSGEIKRYVFPLFSDAPHPQHLRAALDVLGIDNLDTESAFRALFEQSDIWLRAATIWEIGIRRLTGFREKIEELSNSENIVLREAAEKVLHRI
jgi:AAA family ATP:ADP antiporter